jgi:hypothetical protein
MKNLINQRMGIDSIDGLAGQRPLPRSCALCRARVDRLAGSPWHARVNSVPATSLGSLGRQFRETRKLLLAI